MIINVSVDGWNVIMTDFVCMSLRLLLSEGDGHCRSGILSAVDGDGFVVHPHLRGDEAALQRHRPQQETRSSHRKCLIIQFINSLIFFFSPHVYIFHLSFLFRFFCFSTFFRMLLLSSWPWKYWRGRGLGPRHNRSHRRWSRDLAVKGRNAIFNSGPLLESQRQADRLKREKRGRKRDRKREKRNFRNIVGDESSCRDAQRSTFPRAPRPASPLL